MADGLIVLSEADRLFWSIFNNRTYLIPNPCCEVHERKQTYDPDTKHILWIGRISLEKQPMDMLKIFDYVNTRYDKVVCHIVGEGDYKLRNKLQSYVEDHGLESSVIFEGFTLDVDKYYEMADLVVFTSLYEGYPLSFVETASYGIPTVVYDIPWLLYFDLIDGWEKVPQNDIEAAGDIIIRLLSDKNEWENRSMRLYESFLKVASYDVVADWIKVFEDYENGTVLEAKTPDHDESVLIKEFVDFHELGVEWLLKIIKQKEDKYAELSAVLNRTYAEKSGINAKLQQTYKEKAERGIKIKELNAQNEQQETVIRSLEEKNSSLESRLSGCEKRLKDYEKQIKDIKGSKTYRFAKGLSKPFRFVKRKIKR